jgi:hypothetical protein
VRRIDGRCLSEMCIVETAEHGGCSFLLENLGELKYYFHRHDAMHPHYRAMGEWGVGSEAEPFVGRLLQGTILPRH